jgi:hypothetical protein
LDSIASSEPLARSKTAARAAVEGAVVAITGALIASRVWSGPPDVRGIAIGAAAAWAASSASIAWLLWAIGRSMKTFWWAFGGGMVLRAVVLLALALWARGQDWVSFECVLISYVFMLLTLLLSLELRHLKIR